MLINTLSKENGERMMGCWNATCGITNLPICVGDEIVTFLLASADYDYSVEFCYSTDEYAPISLPFHGKYNDYGDNDLDFDHPVNRVSLSLLLNGLIKLDVLDISLSNTSAEIWDKLDYTFLREPIKMKGTYERIIARMHVHKWVYDLLSNKTIKNYGDSPTNKEGYYEKSVEIYEGTKVKSAEFQEKYEKTEDEEEKRMLRRKVWDLILMSDIEMGRHFNIFDAPQSTALRFSQIHEWIMQQAKDQVPVTDDLEAVLREHDAMRMFIISMSGLRKKFSPPAGGGSQSEDWDANIILNKACIEFAEEQKLKYADYEDE